MTGKVSVLMAVHNGEKYLRQAVDSILAQTFSDFEFIIVDDGSNDGTAQILSEYSDPRIILLRNETDIGLTKSLNLCLKKASGEYIARMDADDVSLLHRFEMQVKYLDAHSEIIVLGTAFSFIDSSGKRIQDHQFPSEHELIAWSLPFYNPIAHPTVMMRTAVIRKMGGYNSELRRSQDYDLWWRISMIGKLANLNETLMLLRQHQKQVSREHVDEQFHHGIEINAKYLSRIMACNVSSFIVDKMWSNNIKTVNDAVDVGNLIWEWYRINIARVQSSTAESLIAKDASDKIGRAIAPFAGNFRTFPLISRRFFLFLRNIKSRQLKP